MLVNCVAVSTMYWCFYNIPMIPVAEKTASVDLEGYCNMVASIWSVESSILSSIQVRAEPSGVNDL